MPKYDATLRFAEMMGDKMAFFVNLDWRGVDEKGWGKREAGAPGACDGTRGEWGKDLQGARPWRTS